ncbi:MAG: CoB--CoM heterodisulfide reductase iron-sulfur subunit A family protein, partial [Thermoplasmata archaeon]|nr:CoB--CoM heterodisulfide reductase iron-sulfur subunit A family protein [Thermoplasmata archaeon]
MTEGSVLVIGAGMAGMQASLDLVEQDFRVYLVESKPTIGGKMAQLDKMFPTGECSMCTQLPKMLEITSNPNITLMAFSEVVGLEGSPGDFKVKVLKKPTFVDAMKCTACTECFPACPVGDVPMEFDFGMSKSKAITFYSPFPPRKAIIDPEACTYIKEKRCGEGDVPPCVEACKPEAIDFTQTPQEVDINVGAIVVASGAEPYRPETSKFGYGEFENVLTSIEFERLLSGVGPTGGVVKRKDGNVPKRVAWIQCVGPKDL